MSWIQENRMKTRKKFLQRHEENITKERKAGIFKDYGTISEKSGRIRSNRSRPMTTNFDRNINFMPHEGVISRQPMKDYSTNKKGVFVNDVDDLRPNKIVGATSMEPGMCF